jgi:3-dehydroquinate dehydratase/shikimate dehydrogenase
MSAPVIQTHRLILRPWRDEDVAPWADMNADERVMEFYTNTYTREHAREMAAYLRMRLEQDGYGYWVVEIKEGSRFAGILALQNVPFEAHFTPAFEIGWRLQFDAWGHGYATEGARALLDFAFDELHRDEVVAMTAVLNVRSQRVMERLGMTHEPADDFENPRVEPGHRLRPHVLYRIRR